MIEDGPRAERQSSPVDEPHETRDLSKLQAWAALAVLWIASIAWGSRLYAPCDDAYIFFVYVRSLLEGQGLTFNGEAVWGFTSVLWLGLLSVVGRVGGWAGLPVHVGGELLSVLSALFALAATYGLARALGLERWRALVPAGLLAATGDFAFYAMVGLEHVFFTGWIALATAMVLALRTDDSRGRDFALALVLAAMVLTRPEGALVAAFLLLVFAARRGSLRPSIIIGLQMTALGLPVWIACRLYYGDWLPNTFHVKSGSGLANFPWGLRYLEAAWPRFAVLLLVLALVIAWSFRTKTKSLDRSESRDKRAWILLTLAAVLTLYVTLQGGDNMVGARVLIPVLPLLFVALIALARRLAMARTLVWSFLLAITLGLGYQQDTAVTQHRLDWRRDFQTRQSMALVLRDQFPPDTLVALNPAGIVPYFSRQPTLDMLGLNDRAIGRGNKRDHSLRFGHQAGDGDYVLSRRPVVVLLSGFRAGPGSYISDRELWQTEAFHRDYQAVAWPDAGVLFVRRDHLPGRVP